jgi:CMP-N,N'-diacetyllegionaminic acid synthase
MRILFLITARGGSKGVPRKNLRQIGGISLVGFKAISARRSKYCARLVLSTDDPEIREDGRLYGAEAPFLRPAELATDTASSTAVIRHAMDWVETETGESYDAVMLLQPAAPFARWVDLDNAVELMSATGASVVIGVRETEINSALVGRLDERGRMTQVVEQVRALGRGQRRQDMTPEYAVNGALYLFRWDFFKEHQAIYADGEKSFAYVMDRFHSVDIDEMIDLRWAEFLVANGYVDLSYWR